MNCPHCASAVFQSADNGSKLKARTRILVLHKSGDVEINCAACGRGVLLPLTLNAAPLEIRKASAPRFVARRS